MSRSTIRLAEENKALRAEVERLGKRIGEQDAHAKSMSAGAVEDHAKIRAWIGRAEKAERERDEARVERERYKEAWKRANGLMEAMEDTR